MQYARQTQDALERLDQSLAQLRGFIKRGQNSEAIRFMEEGPLKERFEELQNIITNQNQLWIFLDLEKQLFNMV